MSKSTAQTPGHPRLRDAIRDNGLATLAMVLVVAVAVAGWSASFISLHGFAMVHMGLTERAAWLVPSTFDGAALGLSLLSFRAAIYGRASLGSMLYVYGFTALSSWINWVHIDDHAGGKFVACLLPIAAVLVFGKVLKEAREAYERRHGKQVFRVRPGLLVLRWMADRAGTRAAIRGRILDIPVEALIGLGTESLARQARESLGSDVNGDMAERIGAETGANLAPTSEAESSVNLADLSTPEVPALTIPAQDSAINTPVNTPPLIGLKTLSTDGAEPERISAERAEEIIRFGWETGLGVRETARAADRDPGQVSRKFARLGQANGSR